MKSNKALRIFLITVILVFIFHQLYSSFYKPIATETALYYTMTDGIDINGFIIRNETVLDSNQSGVLHFAITDGERVSNDGVIATVYNDENASITVSQIDNLKNKIADIDEIQKYNNLEATDLELINSKVKDSVFNLIKDCSAGNFTKSDESVSQLLSYLNRRNVVTGVNSDFSAQLQSLNQQLADLSINLPNPIGTVNAPISGYFVSSVDGYEQILKPENIGTLTPEDLDNLKPSEDVNGKIGKIVSDYEWYLAAEISISQSHKYNLGDMVKISTNIKSNPIISATVASINPSKVDQTAVIVLKCNEMSVESAEIRNGPMTIISNQYKGLKIKKSALRVVNSKTGVYVLTGVQINFVPVEVLYSNDEYIICKQGASEGNVLRLYDDVVVKGKRLYDKKVVN